ncbi:MAG: 3-isopropylmalate dehydratase [bacterium]|nr:3-isopropylmalate dehydratase [bacterium]
MLKGRIWKFGDDIDTDQIYPGKYLPLTDKQEMARHAMEGVPGAEKFIKEVKPGDIMVVGKNFGCGSSREHAGVAIKGLGVSLVIAESFAGIYYRNSINIGLPLLECKNISSIKEGTIISVYPETGKIIDSETGKEIYQANPLANLELEIINAGGLLKFLIAKG